MANPNEASALPDNCSATKGYISKFNSQNQEEIGLDSVCDNCEKPILIADFRDANSLAFYCCGVGNDTGFCQRCQDQMKDRVANLLKYEYTSEDFDAQPDGNMCQEASTLGWKAWESAPAAIGVDGQTYMFAGKMAGMPDGEMPGWIYKNQAGQAVSVFND